LGDDRFIIGRKPKVLRELDLPQRADFFANGLNPGAVYRMVLSAFAMGC